MTEDEAKAKTCHRTLAPTHDSLGGVIYGPAACIGSACMAWRWEMTWGTADKINAIRDHRAKHGSSLVDAKSAVEAGWTDTPTSGFCGLAGRPS